MARATGTGPAVPALFVPAFAGRGRSWMGQRWSLPCVVLTRRKPRLLFSLPGELLLRFATRQLLALLFQLPPRFTRFEPDAGPLPFLHAPISIRSLCLQSCGQDTLYPKPGQNPLRRSGAEGQLLRTQKPGETGSLPTAHATTRAQKAGTL